LSSAREAEKRWHYSSVVSEWSTAWEAVKKGLQRVKLKNPLSEALAKEQLVRHSKLEKA
jgi:hypothetical protein